MNFTHITEALAARGHYGLIRRLAIVLADDVDPQRYHKEHGRCPRGYRYDGQKCVPTDDQPRAPQGPADDAVQQKKRQYRDRMRTTVDKLRGAVENGALKGSVRQHVEIARKVQKQHAESFDQTKAALAELAPGMKIKGRVKTTESIVGKLVRKPKYGDARTLQDVTGLRMIGNSIDDVKRTVDAIKAKYKIVTEDNYIDQPNGNYRSHHLIIEDENGLQKEIQVRTQNQNVFADWAHDIYKPVTSDQEKLLQNPKVAERINQYSSIVSDYLFKRDLGEPAGTPPDCPPVVRQVFSCPPINGD